MTSSTDVAQDYLDCVSGDRGEWWQNRANEFIEDYQDTDPKLAWSVWAQVRQTEQEETA